MKKIILISLLLVFTLNANSFKKIKEFENIPKNKKVFVILSMEYCGWCKKQKNEVNKYIVGKYADMEYIIIDKSSNAFRKLVSTGKFDTRFFPSSSIIIIDDKNEINDIFEFIGYQSADNIIEILNDKEIMEIQN